MTFPFRFERVVAFSSTKGVGELPSTTLAYLKGEQRNILSQYSAADRQKIEQRLESLKGVVDVVANDTRIQVFINPAGGGWFWSPAENYIRIDAKDVLEKPIEQNRFTIAHEGAHRRLTRMHLVPAPLQKNGAFHLLNNILEDGRINLWLAGKYPKNHSSKIFEGMRDRYTENQTDYRKQLTQVLQSGNKVPHSGHAANELLMMWVKHLKGEALTVDSRLPKEVKAFLNKVMPEVKNAWKAFPTPGSEAKGEDVIEAHAKKFMNILVNKIWPEFKKLLEDDAKKKGLQDKMKQEENQKQKTEKGSGQQEKGGDQKGNGKDAKPGKGTGLTDGLSENEQKEIDDAKGSDGKVNTDKLSDKLKKKLEESFDSLSKEEKEQLTRGAGQELDRAMEEKAEEHDGKMGESAGEDTKDKADSQKPKNPKGSATKVDSGAYRKGRTAEDAQKQDDMPKMPKDDGDTGAFELRPSALMRKANRSSSWSEFMKRLELDGSLKRAYDTYKKFVESVTTALKSKLDTVFKKRQLAAEKGKQTDGDDLDEDALIDEEIRKQIGAPSPDLEPKVFKQKHRQEGGPRDYAFSILLDASGSMQDHEKIHEAFKGLVVVAETLKHFGIDLEIMGFNWNLFELKPFDKSIDESKESIASILPRPFGPDAGTDIGFAISETVKRLEKRKAKNRTLIVLTDGEPSPRPEHSGPEYHVPNVIRSARDDSKIEVVGVGIGQGTNFVNQIFENGIANVPIEELGRELAIVVKKVIGN